MLDDHAPDQITQGGRGLGLVAPELGERHVPRSNDLLILSLRFSLCLWFVAGRLCARVMMWCPCRRRRVCGTTVLLCRVVMILAASRGEFLLRIGSESGIEVVFSRLLL